MPSTARSAREASRRCAARATGSRCRRPEAVPIRIRLTLGFALVMAVLLLGAGLYMRSRVEAGLNAGIDHGLTARVVDLTALVKQSESGLGEAKARPSEADFAQIAT